MGCDVSGVALRLARSRFPALEFVQCSEELPFDDDSFDVVWAGEVIEHVQDGLGLMAEIHRVLRRRGRLLVSTPDHGALRRLHLGLSRRAFERNFDPRSDHVRFFTAATLRAVLTVSAFAEVEVASRRHVLLARSTSVQLAGPTPPSS